jgi:SrtB family sortase
MSNNKGGFHMSEFFDNTQTAVISDNSAFIDSLDSLTVDDIVPPNRKKRKKKSASLSKFSRLFIVFLCFAVFVYCMSELTAIVNDYQKGDDLYDEIENGFLSSIVDVIPDIVVQMNISGIDAPMMNFDEIKENGPQIYEPPVNTIDKVTASAKFIKRLTYIEMLRDTKNKDTYGYINIPNSQISYPMVQCADNDYYLTHAYDGSPLAVGAIFIDCRNEKKVEKNRNIVIYGHNMLNGSMFCDATKFLEEDFFMNTAHDIEITTFDGLYTFRVFSAYPTDKYDNYFKTYFPTKEEFVQFCIDREAKSLYHREGVTFSPDDVIITLSTCILGNDDGRYAVHAKLIKVET